jgi:hypothetical protein
MYIDLLVYQTQTQHALVSSLVIKRQKEYNVHAIFFHRHSLPDRSKNHTLTPSYSPSSVLFMSLPQAMMMAGPREYILKSSTTNYLCYSGHKFETLSYD